MKYEDKCSMYNKVKENFLSNTCNSCWLESVNKWNRRSWRNLGNIDNE